MTKRERLCAARDRLQQASHEWRVKARALEQFSDEQAWADTWSMACERKAGEVSQRIVRMRTWRDDPSKF